MGPRQDDDVAASKFMKVFIGGLPPDVKEHEVGNHFAKYGHVTEVSIVAGEINGRPAPYAFATFAQAPDADCAVVDAQYFPGVRSPLGMGFAKRKGKDSGKNDYGDGDPCKVFVGGISDRDSEEQIGDFFSQWGLVVMVYRDRSWGMVAFATKEGAQRLLEEGSVVYQRRRLEIKPSDKAQRTPEGERQELIKRALSRHFHKKQQPPPAAHPGFPPHGNYPPPSQYPPPGGNYGHGPPPSGPPPGPYTGAPPGPGYPPHGPPPSSYPPPSNSYPPSSYPPQGPPPGQPTPGYPPPSSAGPYGAPSHGGPPPSHYPPPSGAPDYPPPAGVDPYAPRPRDPYAPPDAGAYGGPPPAQPSSHDGYYRDSRPSERPPEPGYYGAPPRDPYAMPPQQALPSSDPYYQSHGPPPGNDRYRPY